MFFFFNDTATTEIYTLSLHDALPIWRSCCSIHRSPAILHLNLNTAVPTNPRCPPVASLLHPLTLILNTNGGRSEEHTSELQSQSNLVCRLLLEKKKTRSSSAYHHTLP